MKNGFLMTAAAILFALSAIPANAGGKCNHHPGDYLGRDGRCHLASTSGQPAASVRPRAFLNARRVESVHHRGFDGHHVEIPALRSQRAMPVTKRGEIPAEDRKAYEGFIARGNEQAAKRAAIHGIEVKPEITGGVGSASHIHIPAIVTERGAI